MKKRLCVILAVVLIIGCFCIPASAIEEEESALSSLAESFLTDAAVARYKFQNKELISRTISSLSDEEISYIITEAEKCSLDVTVDPEVGEYQDSKARYCRYTLMHEGLWIKNFQLTFGEPEIRVDGDFARVRIFQTVGMRYPGLDVDSAISGPVDMDLVKTPDGWKICSMQTDENFDKIHRGHLNYEEEISKYIDTYGKTDIFSDIPANAWYKETANIIAEAGVLIGDGNGHFDPERSMTRAMFVTALYNLDGNSEEYTNIYFSDVNSDSWYAKSVAWAAERNLISGKSKNNFAPNDVISRQEAATILYQYASYRGADTSHGNTAINGFKDRESLAGWARDAMDWAVERDIFSGYGNGILGPRNSMTRSEAAKVLVQIKDIKMAS